MEHGIFTRLFFRLYLSSGREKEKEKKGWGSNRVYFSSYWAHFESITSPYPGLQEPFMGGEELTQDPAFNFWILNFEFWILSHECYLIRRRGAGGPARDNHPGIYAFIFHSILPPGRVCFVDGWDFIQPTIWAIAVLWPLGGYASLQLRFCDNCERGIFSISIPLDGLAIQ